MADFTDLDWAFSCPDSVTDVDLRTGYEILAERFRREGEHLTLPTAWQLLIERTIASYIKVKQAERYPYAAPGGYQHAGQEKDFNIFVKDMLHEVQEVLRKNSPNAERDLVLDQVKTVILQVVGALADTRIREDLARRFAVAFEANGM